MQRLTKEGLLVHIEQVSLPICERCLAGKSTRKSFGKATRAELLFQLIHSDIYGLMNMQTRRRASYFITFIDDFNRFGHVYLISHKSEAMSCFKKYVSLKEN